MWEAFGALAFYIGVDLLCMIALNIGHNGDKFKQASLNEDLSGFPLRPRRNHHKLAVFVEGVL